MSKSKSIINIILDSVKLNGGTMPTHEMIDWIFEKGYPGVSKQIISGCISWSCNPDSNIGLKYNNGIIYIK